MANGRAAMNDGLFAAGFHLQPDVLPWKPVKPGENHQIIISKQ